MKELIQKKLPLPILMKATIIMLFWILLFLLLERFRNILYPLCLGVLFSLLLRPVMLFLIDRKFPRILAVFCSLLLGISIVYGTIFSISNQVSHIINESQDIETQAHQNLQAALSLVENTFDIPIEDQKHWLRQKIANLGSSSSRSINKVIGATTQTVFTFGILPVYVFFILFYSNRFKKFLLMLISSKEDKSKSTNILSEISKVTQHYMSGMFLVVIILAVINSFGFYLIGLKHPILFGVMAAILNFIPYFGTIFGFSVPFFLSLVIMDSPMYAVKILLMFVIVQFTENNLLTPNIVGNRLKINPLIIIVSVLFGGSVWGLPGMFAIVPFVGMIKIICMNIPKLRPWGYLLGAEKTPDLDK
jgi:predicted PurR-regulated permease PerM